MNLQAIQGRLQTLRELAAQLDKSIADKEAKVHFLRPAGAFLSDAEYALSQGLIAPNPADASMWFGRVELQLLSAEKQLKNVQDMVSKYGPNLWAVDK
jgi:hypothetical protein